MQQVREHMWEPLSEYQISSQEEFLMYAEDGIERKVQILRNLPLNKYLVVDNLPATITNTQPFQKTIKNLRSYGLDIDRGDAKYGFKMPLPKNGDMKRDLIIFRRK